MCDEVRSPAADVIISFHLHIHSQFLGLGADPIRYSILLFPLWSCCGNTVQKIEGFVISNLIPVKFGRIVLQVFASIDGGGFLI